MMYHINNLVTKKDLPPDSVLPPRLQINGDAVGIVKMLNEEHGDYSNSERRKCMGIVYLGFKYHINEALNDPEHFDSALRLIGAGNGLGMPVGSMVQKLNSVETALEY